MEKLENQAASLADLVEIFKRRKLTLLLSVIVGLIPALLYNHWATPIYQAAVIVAFEDYGKEAVSGFDFAGSPYRENFVANRIQEMQTKAFARQVYDELPDSTRRLFQWPNPVSADFSAESYVASTIRANLSVAALKTTDLVTITYAAENPQLAKTVANTVATVLLKSNLQVRRQEHTNAREFIGEQIRGIKDRLQQAEDTLRDFKTRESITSLEDESKEILQRITQTEVLYNQIQTDKDARQRRLTVIQKKLDEQKQNLASSMTQVNNPLTVRLKEKLVELEVRYSNLQVQNYPDNHPKLVELKAEIDQTKQNLIRTTLKLIDGDKPQGLIDPLSQLQKYLEEIIVLEVELQALSAQEDHLQKTLKNYSGYLKKLPNKELNLARLMRDKEVNTKIYTRLLEEHEQARIREAAATGSIRVMESAETPRVPARPRKLLNAIIGLFAGTVIGLLLIGAHESTKQAPRTQEEAERILRLPVLTLIPLIKRGLTFELNGRHRERVLLGHEAAPSVQDAYSCLWSSLQFSNRRRSLMVMITSTGPAEGKSTIASNLALTAARHGKKTILIDGDLRQPVLHEIFGMSCSPGLRNLVIEASQTWPAHILPAETRALTEPATSLALDLSSESFRSFHQTIFPALDSALQLTSTANLRILTMGDPLLAPDVLWNSPLTEEILSMLRRIADFIVIDTPPVIGIPDASIMARYCDGILFCVAAGQTEKTMLTRARKILEQAGNKLWGVVLNKVDPDSIYGSNKYYKDYMKR